MADEVKPMHCNRRRKPLGRKVTVISFTKGKIRQKTVVRRGVSNALQHIAKYVDATSEQTETPCSSNQSDALGGATTEYPDCSAAPEKRTHQSKKEKQYEAWKAVRNDIRCAIIESLTHQSNICSHCSSSDALIWCEDCGPLVYYCTDCFQHHHPSPHLHKPLLWQDDMYVPYSFYQPPLSRPGHKCPNPKMPKTLCVDDKGRQHEIQVEFCSCEPESVTLVRHHLWPASPTLPVVAFTFQLMDWICIMQLECHVSLDRFTAALQNRNGDRLGGVNQVFVRDIYRTLLGGCVDEYRFGKMELLNLEQGDGTSCPACPSPDESDPVFISLDGNFGLCRKRSSGISAGPPRHDDHPVFCRQTEVDDFINKYDDSPSVNEECHDFEAGSRVRSSMKSKKLDETGIFGTACKHSFPKLFLNLKHGERLGYVVFILERLLASCTEHTNLFILYDIACRLESHLKAGGHHGMLEKITLAIPIFHSFGHKWKCQILYGPRRIEGMGLVDGEVMERLWSYLRGFNKMTKEMTPEHRHDLLVDALLYHSWKLKGKLGHSLLEKMKNAEKVAQKAKQDLESQLALPEVDLTMESIQQAVMDEKQKASNPAPSKKPSAQDETLQKIQKCRQERQYLAGLQKKYPSQRTDITADQREKLNTKWEEGMTSGKQSDLLQSAIRETGLTEQVVKNWIGNKKRQESGKTYNRRKPAVVRGPSGFNLFARDNKLGDFADMAAQWKGLEEEEKASYSERARAERISPPQPTTEEEKLMRVKAHVATLMQAFSSLNELGVHFLAAVKQPNGKILDISSEKGAQYGQQHGFIEGFDEFCGQQKDDKDSEVKDGTPIADLQRQVKELFNRKYSEACKKNKQMSYKDVQSGKIRMEGLPAWIALKKPSQYGRLKCEEILKNADNIKLSIVPNPSEEDRQADSADSRNNESNVMEDATSVLEELARGGTKLVPVETEGNLLNGDEIEAITPHYQVKKILKERKRKRKVEYLVEWEGYSREEASWEPFEHILDDELIAQWRSSKKIKS